MFGMGMGELLVILVIALLFLGPARLPEAARALGKGLREIRRQRRDLEETLEQDETLGSTMREIKSVLRGDLVAPELAPRRPSDPPGASPTTQEASSAPVPASSHATSEDGPAPAVSTSSHGTRSPNG